MERMVPYRAYLLRVWSTKRGGVAGHRASLESVTTGERQDFPNLEALVAYLRAQGDAWRNQQDRDGSSDGQDDELRGPNKSVAEHVVSTGAENTI